MDIKFYQQVGSIYEYYDNFKVTFEVKIEEGQLTKTTDHSVQGNLKTYILKKLYEIRISATTKLGISIFKCQAAVPKRKNIFPNDQSWSERNHS